MWGHVMLDSYLGRIIQLPTAMILINYTLVLNLRSSSLVCTLRIRIRASIAGCLKPASNGRTGCSVTNDHENSTQTGSLNEPQMPGLTGTPHIQPKNGTDMGLPRHVRHVVSGLRWPTRLHIYSFRSTPGPNPGHFTPLPSSTQTPVRRSPAFSDMAGSGPDDDQ